MTESAIAHAPADVMQFEMTHRFFNSTPESFSTLNAPAWLTSENTIRGSTMDNRWFWREHVLTLQVGESVKTDFHIIKRVA